MEKPDLRYLCDAPEGRPPADLPVGALGAGFLLGAVSKDQIITVSNKWSDVLKLHFSVVLTSITEVKNASITLDHVFVL